MKKTSIIFFCLCTILCSCSTENKKVTSPQYPIDEQENNVIMHFYDSDISEEEKQYKIYFYITDFKNRELDTVFDFMIDKNIDTYLDIRISNNLLILTEIEHPDNQKIIDLENMFPTIFDANIENEWKVSEINTEAINYFGENGFFTMFSDVFFESFQIYNEQQNISFNVFILALGYAEYDAYIN